MSKRKTLTSAERIIERAVSEETEALRAELRATQQKIREYEALFARIAGLVGAVASAPASAMPAPQRAVEMPVVQEEEIPSGPEGELNDADILGEGRWL